MKKMGFSTGCLYKVLTNEEALMFYQEKQVSFIELGLLTSKKLLNCDPFFLAKHSNTFGTITIHAPCIRMSYKKSVETSTLFKKLTEINEAVNLHTVVFHPDTIEDFSIFDHVPFKVSLENMDADQAMGIRPEEFERWKTELDYTLVLDIQHVYEHDPSMQLGRELYDCMKGQFSHFHISGQNKDSRHALLHLATNREPILNFYNEHQGTPAVEEGIFTQNYCLEMVRELTLIKNGRKE